MGSMVVQDYPRSGGRVDLGRGLGTRGKNEGEPRAIPGSRVLRPYNTRALGGNCWRLELQCPGSLSAGGPTFIFSAAGPQCWTGVGGTEPTHRQRTEAAVQAGSLTCLRLCSAAVGFVNRFRILRGAGQQGDARHAGRKRD